MTGLGLAALAEEDDVLARQDRVLDLGNDGLVVADDAGEERSPRSSFRMRFWRISVLTERGA